MATKPKKTLDDASLRAMANMATSSSDLSKLQENFGWNGDDPATDTTPSIASSDVITSQPAPESPKTVAEAPAEPATDDVIEEATPKSTKPAPEANTAKKVGKYSTTYLEPISGFERPTKVAYVSKRSHSFISLLQRYASLTGSKVSMQEIMENIFRQHFADNKAEIESIRATLLKKEAELHE